MNRPGGNITGISYYTGALNAKRLEMLREIVPQPGLFGFLTNPTNLVSRSSVPDVEASARSVGQRIIIFNASSPDGIDRAFASAAQQNVKAILVDVDAFFAGRHQHIVTLAARYGIPACYANRLFPAAGGLMSYSDDRLESVRQAGVYVGRILKGEKPGDLPVQTPSKFDLVINLRTAKTLGLTVPNTLLISAKEVIE
jgi:putative ABC transport system substrate-binding protein